MLQFPPTHHPLQPPSGGTGSPSLPADQAVLGWRTSLHCLSSSRVIATMCVSPHIRNTHRPAQEICAGRGALWNCALSHYAKPAHVETDHEGSGRPDVDIIYEATQARNAFCACVLLRNLGLEFWARGMVLSSCICQRKKKGTNNPYFFLSVHSQTFGPLPDEASQWKKLRSAWQQHVFKCPIQIILLVNSQKTHLQMSLLLSLEPISSICVLWITNSHFIA